MSAKKSRKARIEAGRDAVRAGRRNGPSTNVKVTLVLVAAAYNAGEGAVQRYGGVPPYAETEDYVEKVQALYERYRSALRKPVRKG